jgi:hypothetical protein
MPSLASHFRFYYLLLLVTEPSLPVRLKTPFSRMAFMEVLLTLLLPMVLTFGSLTGTSGLRMPVPLLFMMAVLLLGAGGFKVAL